jgi:hypothetical protein
VASYPRTVGGGVVRRTGVRWPLGGVGCRTRKPGRRWIQETGGGIILLECPFWPTPRILFADHRRQRTSSTLSYRQLQLQALPSAHAVRNPPRRCWNHLNNHIILDRNTTR